MSGTTQPFRIRPGCSADVTHAARLYCASFANDSLIQLLFPGRENHPHSIFIDTLYSLFSVRYWTPGYYLSILEHEVTKEAVGFSWWKRPMSSYSFREWWLSPYMWAAPVMRLYHTIKAKLWPSPFNSTTAGTYLRAFSEIQKSLLTTQRKRDAWYLSTLSVDPAFQGRGLGGMLLLDGLQEVEKTGAASYLVGVHASEPFYEKHGYVETSRANVGELQAWDGGAIMWRNL